MKLPKLSVSFSGSCPPKLLVSMAINLERADLLMVTYADSLEDPGLSSYQFLIIHNFLI